MQRHALLLHCNNAHITQAYDKCSVTMLHIELSTVTQWYDSDYQQLALYQVHVMVPKLATVVLLAGPLLLCTTPPAGYNVYAINARASMVCASKTMLAVLASHCQCILRNKTALRASVKRKPAASHTVVACCWCLLLVRYMCMSLDTAKYKHHTSTHRCKQTGSYYDVVTRCWCLVLCATCAYH